MKAQVERWVVVESKGRTWLVSDRANVRVPAHTTAYTRTRAGKVQQFSANFPERSCTPTLARNGYLEVAFLQNGRRVKERVHRLVALAFVPGHDDGLTVNHIDGNKTHNLPNNLEWVSLARNTQHAWETGLVNLRGEKHPGAKLTSKQVVYIRRLLAQGIPAHTLDIIAGVSPGFVSKIAKGTRRAPGPAKV